MLSYILALAVGIGGFALYMAAFFFPEVHRKGDFIWSGVAMFYALVLWFCAGRITGAVLLGEAAGVALLGWFGWETLRLRREVTPSGERTQVSQEKLSAGVSQLSGRVTGLFKGKPQQPKAELKVETPAAEPETAAATKAPSEEMPPSPEATVAATATVAEALTPEVPAAEQPAKAAVEPAPAGSQTEPEKIPAAAALEGATAESLAPPEEETLEEEGFEPEPPLPPVPAKPPAAGVKPVLDKAKPASGAGAGQILAPVSGAIGKIQEGIQGLVSKINKPKSQPAPKTPPAKAVPDTAKELSDDDAFPLEMDVTFEPVPPKPASAESIHITVGSEPRAPGKPVTDEWEEPAIGEVELQVATAETEAIVEGVAAIVEPALSATTAEPELVAPNPPTPELVEAATTPAEEVKEAAAQGQVEEIAPEAELAPPADNAEGQIETPAAAEPQPAAALEVSPLEEAVPVPEAAPPAPPSDAEAPKKEEGFAQLLRPKRPDPAVVEAEKKPAEAKSVTPPPADSEAPAAGEGNS
ncbi:MAG: hypothetical protein MUC60_09860 [Oscillatoria sp. Prado101]|jgi:hypothetical protein|nr:hypothetical protein [Oscillatoria sp. Prado101]